MDSIVLAVENLSFSYGTRQALAGVDLKVRAGEMVGVIGPNGSGKSTLLRTISGVLRPYRGRVLLDGDDITHLRRAELARRLGVVPQNPSLPETFAAVDVVLLGRTPHLRFLQSEGRRDLEVVRQAMKVCGVWELAERRVGELSGGERQRVVIARALAQEPRLLLLDEPTSHLDIAHQVAIMDLIWSLSQQQGLAVLAVFHDLNLAAQYCDRLLVLNAGRLVGEGSSREVLTPEIVKLAYGTEVCIVSHPLNLMPVALVTGNNHKAKGEER